MSPPRPGPVKLRFIFAAYAFVAAVVTYPLVLSPLQHVIGTSLPPGEAVPPLNIWAMHTVLRQLFHDPLHLFDGTAFYPYARTVTMSEHLLAPALLGAPVAWLTGNLVLTYNVLTLLTFALAGLGMYLLAREVAGDGLPAFVAGLFYAFHSWNVNETVRLQILSNEWFPFLLLAFMRFFKQPTGRNAALGQLVLLLAVPELHVLGALRPAADRGQPRVSASGGSVCPGVRCASWPSPSLPRCCWSP